MVIQSYIVAALGLSQQYNPWQLSALAVLLS
jgi:hypothetical protein